MIAAACGAETEQAHAAAPADPLHGAEEVPEEQHVLSLLDLADAPEIFRRAISDDITSFWQLSIVSKRCRQLAIEGAGRIVTLDAPSVSGPLYSCHRRGCTPSLPSFVRHLSSLHSLDLTGSYHWVDDAVLEAIGGTCEKLEELHLDQCQQITAAGLMAMASQGKLQRLELLSIRSCRDVGSGAFLQHLPSLRHLVADWCFTLQAEQVAAIASKLETLHLQGCDQMSDALCSVLSSIHVLDLSMTSVTDQGLLALGRHSLHLRKLYLAWRADNVWMDGMWSENGMRMLKALRPDVAIIVGGAAQPY